ncbi:hypothetical protein OHT42_004900, partial [Salmonella enterica subsp. enterica serovar Kentucky]|nr:hypothetical protein [Salmonella enterica subsp. enterica serovar Kentucky]
PPTSPGQRHDGNTYSGNNTVSGGQDGDTSLPESHLPISSDTNNVEKDASASISSDKGHDPHSESEGGGISTTHSGDVLVSDNPELDENKGVTVDGNSLFKKVDNAALLKKARAMFTSREFILSDSADRWQQVIDNNETENGIWAITGYRHGGYEAFTINQSGLNVG